MTIAELYEPTELEPFEDLIGGDNFDGGVPKGTPTGLVGPPESGMTGLSTQLSCELAARQRKDVFVLDTELNHHTFFVLAEAFSDRFGTDINPVQVKLEVENTDRKDDPDWEVTFHTVAGEADEGSVNLYILQTNKMRDILVLHGRGARIDVVSSKGEAGKVQVDLLQNSWAGSPFESPLGRWLGERDISSMVYDSITKPIDDIPANTKNFPGRADVTQVWLTQISKLAAAFSTPLFTVHHHTRNPASPWDMDGGVKGGESVKYNTKHFVYLMKDAHNGLTPSHAPDAPKLADTGRSLWNMRHPAEQAWTRFVKVDRTDEGFVPYE